MLHRRWLLLLVLPIAACASLGDTFDVTPFLREQITGDTWRACSAREYQMQTRYVLRTDRNWAEASRFSSKGWAALKGDSPQHWQASEFGMETTRLRDAQLELDSRLGKWAHPDECACAKAEAAYDGWLAAAARQAANQEQVEKNFHDALAACGPRKMESGVEAE